MPAIIGQTVKLADMANPSKGLRFEQCTIFGPAVLAPFDCHFIACNFVGDPNGLIWEVEPEQPMEGVVVLQECEFVECEFRNIGLALFPEAAEEFRAAIRPHSADATGAVPVSG